MSKCGFNKVAKQSNFIEIVVWHRCFPVTLLHIFKTPIPKNTSRGLLLYLLYHCNISTDIFITDTFIVLSTFILFLLLNSSFFVFSG